jgi:hypothetical protein
MEEGHIRTRWSDDFDAERPFSRHMKADPVYEEFADRSRSAHMRIGLEAMAVLGHPAAKRETRRSERHPIRRLDRDDPTMQPTDPGRSFLGPQ